MRRRCGSLAASAEGDWKRIPQLMLKLLFGSTKVDFDKFEAAIGSPCPSALTYLQRAMLPYEEMWACQSVKQLPNLGLFTTNKVKAANRQLKRCLSMRSTLFVVYSQIMHPTAKPDEARRSRIGEEFLGGSVPPRGMGMYASQLSRISQFANGDVEGSVAAHKLVYLQEVSGFWKFGSLRSCDARTLMVIRQSSTCTF